MATIYDVARRAGVSITTVSRVLNGGKVREQTRVAVEKAMAELQYVPNPAARGLPLGINRIIAVVVPDISNPFYAELVRGVQDACDAAGFGTMIWNTDGRPDKEAACIEELSRQRVDGVHMVRYLTDASAFQRLRALKIPLVLAGAPPDDLAVDSVGTFGTLSALTELIAPLVRAGKRRLGHVAGSDATVVGKVRRRQYKAIVEHFDLEQSATLIVESDFTRAGGFHAARKLLSLDHRPDMIFAANDMVAIGVLQACEESGLTVPEDIAVIGCDDIELADLLRPSLSSIRMPKYELGRKGAELLLQRITEPAEQVRHIEMEVKPVHRDSTRLS